MGQYATTEIKRLANEARRTNSRLDRLKQIDRAESIAARIQPTEDYAPRELCIQIRDEIDAESSELTASLVRKRGRKPAMVSGAEALQDLRLFIEEVSQEDVIDIQEAAEPIWTVQDLSERFGVSQKTIDRWRDRGLMGRRFRLNGRSRIGFLDSTVRRFVREHATEVERGKKFTQMSATEREEILRQAEQLARHEFRMSEIAARLGKQFGRSPETIRYTIQQHDLDTPETAIFPTTSATMTADQKRDLCQKFRRGVPIERLEKQFRRTKASIYRIVGEVRAEKLLGEAVDYMDSPEFHEPKAAATILAPAPVVVKKGGVVRPPAGLPPYLASLYSIPLLTREEEQYWFRKMNFLKFRATQLQQEINPKRPKTAILDELEQTIAEATEVKNFLIRSNLRLVVSIAKKHIKPTNNFFEMVSDGNMSLIRAIEKFDYTKGNKFSTYATWAIMKNFARSIPAEHKRLDRFRTGKDEVFSHSTDRRANPFQEEMTNRHQHGAIMEILDQLDMRERDIIKFRYGLGADQEPLTLEQVGQRFGVTKERIRQLESRALRKLKKIAEDGKMDIPGIV